jgi:hypothetical protein
MFKFKDFADGRTKAENVEITKNMLDKLPDTIPYILSSHTAVGDENQKEDNYDLILISDFESLETLEKYKIHPDHVAVGDFMRPVRISRVCIDYNI